MAGVSSTIPRRFAAFATAIVTAIVVTAIAILPFLTPQWVAFEQDRSAAAAWTGYTPAELRTATDAILADLVFGPPDFDVAVGGEPVLAERERQHMRDVRGVFFGFGLLAVVSGIVLAAAVIGARLLGHPERAWSAIRRGAIGLAVGVVVAGVVAAVAFDAAFELFHRLFFPSGSYLFDPRTDRLVQLFPFTFWSETTMTVGGVILVLAVGIAFVAGRRNRAIAPAAAVRPPLSRPETETAR